MKTLEQKAEYARNWRRKNKDRHSAYQREYRKRRIKEPGYKERLDENKRRFIENNPAAPRAYSLCFYHGISIEKFNNFLKEQNGVCSICKEPSEQGKTFHVDHDHKCCPGRASCGKCIRGLLCESCNRGLGQFKDSIERLKSAILYIENK